MSETAAELLPPENEELNEYGRKNSNVILVLGLPGQFVVTKLQCDNCGWIYYFAAPETETQEQQRLPLYCSICGQSHREGDEIVYDEQF